MLILSRKEDETIVVGDDIRIVICRVIGGRVKIGLEAPADVRIRRGELVEFDDDRCQLRHELLTTVED